MSKTILIVEDESAIAANLSYALATDGFTPQHVLLGQQALDLLQTPGTEAPALIVLDIGLPDMNGFEVCRRLRQFSNTPVIFLTARADEIDRVVGLEMGADDYVIKPFSPRELVARIRAVLRRFQSTNAPAATSTTPSMPQAAAPEVAPAAKHAALLQVRADEGRILFCGVTITLTRYEYLLLKTLAERPGQLYSRAQLMDLVWTNAPDTLERTIDAHIKSLRGKLKQINAELDPIQTHRGLGYSLQL